MRQCIVAVLHPEHATTRRLTMSCGHTVTVRVGALARMVAQGLTWDCLRCDRGAPVYEPGSPSPVRLAGGAH